MLTADLVNTRRQGNQLRVVPLDAKARSRATELAACFLQIARSHIGRSRQELDEACAAVEVSARERRLAAGIRKLIEDRCDFDANSRLDPEELLPELAACHVSKHCGSAWPQRSLQSAHLANPQAGSEERKQGESAVPDRLR